MRSVLSTRRPLSPFGHSDPVAGCLSAPRPIVVEQHPVSDGEQGAARGGAAVVPDGD
ncbi:hypothetical protein OHJ16_07550 [Actinomyces israelii]|uniref:Uncharacterized protein n=1 Tax=Actinomyces israelii TaxID=1659 RepID=A0ABT4I9Z2_9ACTO|nr:hypothetical protein [Actinomyces israelii]MCZ0857898.1 hypothetical protein [Actinomyces israelii]